MMRNVRRVALLLCAMLLATYTVAQAVTVDFDRKGTLEIQLESKLAPDLSGVVFFIYRIGEIDNTGGGIKYKATGQFVELGLTLDYTTSHEIDAAAKALESFIGSKGILPIATARASKSGAAVFASLGSGVYFVQAAGGPLGLRVSPFIISIPYFKDGKLYYTVPVYPKAEIVPTPTPTLWPTPRPTPCPTPRPTPPPGSWWLPQTGVLRWPVVALSIGAAILIVLGIWSLYSSRRQKRRKK